MSTFVLVHGAWHGAWCWHKTVAELEKLGHSAIVPDLPGHGEDATPLAEIDLANYVERVVECLDGPPERVVLVGHSMGGLVISGVAERVPERVARLVYLAAILPTDGEGFAHIPAAPRIAEAVESDGESLRLRLEVAQELFYADCSEADVVFALERMCPQPLGAREPALALTAERFGRVSRDYVECLQDRVIELEAQRAQHRRSPCRRVHSLDSSHSPFFSMPVRLAALLDEIAP